MNRERYYRYRYHCFPTVLAAVAKVVVLVAVVLSPMVSCGVTTLRPKKYLSALVASRQPSVGTRLCSRMTFRSSTIDKGHCRTGTFEKGHHRFANSGNRNRIKFFVARLDGSRLKVDYYYYYYPVEVDRPYFKSTVVQVK